MLHVLEHTIIDCIKLLPFLFIAYLIIEFIEQKAGDKTINIIKKSGKFGPVLGSLLGVVPQCGFSAAATNFYAGKIITIGTLIAIFLSPYLKTFFGSTLLPFSSRIVIYLLST